MKIKIIILHVGSPKTGTTSLQKSVFPLMKSCKYLGKHIGVRNSTIFSKIAYMVNSAPKDEFLSKAHEINVLLSEIEENRIFISDESFCVASSTSYGLISVREKIKRLSLILSGHDVIALLTIRNQNEAVFSLYVELYSTYKIIYGFRSFGDVVRNCPEILCDSFDYYMIQSVLKEYFSRIDIKYYLFEEMKEGDRGFVDKLMSEIGELTTMPYLLSHDNVKFKVEGAVKVGDVSLTRNLELFITSRLPSIYRVVKKYKLTSNIVKFLWRNLTNVSSGMVKSGTFLNIPTKDEKEYIIGYYKDKNKKLVKEVPELTETLEKYDYPI